MNLVVSGATGMVGQGALRECLVDPDVRRILSVGRSPTGAQHPKLQEIVHKDLLHYAELEDQLTGFDGCFYCLGVSSSGKPTTHALHTTSVWLRPKHCFASIRK